MRTDYTPTTEEVKGAYHKHRYYSDPRFRYNLGSLEEFDRWLAELIRKEREEAILQLQYKLARISKVQDMCPDEIIDCIPEVWVNSQPLKNCTSCEETAEDLVSTTRLGGVCIYCLEACSNET